MKLWIRVFIVTLLPLWVLRAELGGDRARPSMFTGWITIGNRHSETCHFAIEIERIGFVVNSFRNTYKVIRVRAKNDLPESIKLSAEEDEIEMEMNGGGVVRGTFNLQGRDAAAWDQLPEDLRKAMAYPLSLKAGKAEDGKAAQGEAIYLFAFFPADKVGEIPLRFRYRLKSTATIVEIRLPQATAR